MDPILNPYAPGAGTQPPELAGRDQLREAIRISLARTRLGLLRLSRNERAKNLAERALRGLALSQPAKDEGVAFEKEALDQIIAETKCYPSFLQEWGKHVWDVAIESPITRNDASVASVISIAALDESFFRVRFDRLTLLEKRYLRAMAELGHVPHRSGDVAQQLGREVTSLTPLRN